EPASDCIRFLENVRTCLRLDRLICYAPERPTNLHSGNFAVTALARVWFAHYLVFFCQSGIENPAEIHVASVSACAQDHTFLCLHVQCLAFVRDLDALYSSGEGIFADQACHAMLQQNFHAELSRASFQRTHQCGSVAAVGSVRVRFARPYHGMRSRYRLGSSV